MNHFRLSNQTPASCLCITPSKGRGVQAGLSNMQKSCSRKLFDPWVLPSPDRMTSRGGEH